MGRGKEGGKEGLGGEEWRKEVNIGFMCYYSGVSDCIMCKHYCINLIQNEYFRPVGDISVVKMSVLFSQTSHWIKRQFAQF